LADTEPTDMQFPLVAKYVPLMDWHFALWAPTARSVEVILYPQSLGDDSRLVVTMNRHITELDTGVWLAQCPSSWRDCYYTYRVIAFHPSTGQFEEMESPDPYSRGCSADGRRSLVCDLAFCDSAAPPGWSSFSKPPLTFRATASLYELHVRDYSASDLTVPQEMRGKYVAFEQERTQGDRHLRDLAKAGLTHVHLLPTYDFGSVPERACDRTEPDIPASAAPDSELQQAAVAASAEKDSYNWGYDPVLFGVPEGSYATEPDGLARIVEHRRMVAGLSSKGLRVVLDVVYNHVHGSGPFGGNSVLDKCVPGYYLRRNEDGWVENSTCMNNTASERKMMERLIVDDVLHWAVNYRVDGFRFDLMGHITLRCMQRCRAELDMLTLEQHGVDGPRILMYGEGWEFGEIEGGKRGAMACQRQLANTGIGSFNDKVRDAVLGGSPFSDPRTQGFATGLGLRSSQDIDQGDKVSQIRNLLVASDKIRIALAGSLKSLVLDEDCEGSHDVAAALVHGGGVGYVGFPQEIVNYVSAHDNETLYDQMVWKMPASLYGPDERMRASWLCTAIIALSHGVPFFHAGDELLRSKSLDRDSYNSGDWFNMLDFGGSQSAFGRGLPVADKNKEKWDLMRPLLLNDSLRPTPEMIKATVTKFHELLRIRSSTPLIGLTCAEHILAQVDFPGCGSSQSPGIIVMQTRSRMLDSRALCTHLARVVVILNAQPQSSRVLAPPPGPVMLRLHPLQAVSADEATQKAFFDFKDNVFVVPPISATVFVEPLPGSESWDGVL